jgi:hypothetical protein
MLTRPERDVRLACLQRDIECARCVSRELISTVIEQGCVRLLNMRLNGAKEQLRRFIAAEAWTDAAFALLEIELPQWKLRRLAYEDGQWYCSLSRYPGLPSELDEIAYGSHEVLPLAILSAFVQARCAAGLIVTPANPVPQVRSALGCVACCDDFA